MTAAEMTAAALDLRDRYGAGTPEFRRAMAELGRLAAEGGGRGGEDFDEVSPAKAREILRDGTAHGEPLTGKQRRYFGWLAGGGGKK